MSKYADILHALSSVSMVHDPINFSDTIASLLPWYRQFIEFDLGPNNYKLLMIASTKKKY